MLEKQPLGQSQTNRLIHEKSPYLLQHAANPVDWYPWGHEALERAARENKPIFLSIGYSTCHWCHVMAHESFESPEIAAMLNQWFVSIKVDREEHPDIDHIYMSAVTTMTGHGGWPLTIFMTPQGKPFFGGTYFPPERRWNLTGMRELLPAVADAWENRREDLLSSAEHLTVALKERLDPQLSIGDVAVDVLHRAFNEAVASFDDTYGGFGQAPKFPRSHELSFLLHYWARTKDARARDMVTRTLDHLERGGIHDHLGGGFHRYSTDEQWLVPHFEKMLYDQALLTRTYLEAYRLTGRLTYAIVARRILEYVLRDLADSNGAFYAAEDADSEGEEGKFYVWTPEQVAEVIEKESAAWVNAYYGISPEGNFEHGKNVLHQACPLEEIAKLQGVDAQKLEDRLAELSTKLFAARAKRSRPHRDEKILTSWNGLMIGSLAYAASTLEDPRYLTAARRAADFMRQHIWRDGILLRRYREGEAHYHGTLEDYAFFSYGLLELYEAGYDPRDLIDAKKLADAIIEKFWDEKQGGFFLRDQQDPGLIVSVKDPYDGATPSGNSVAILVLLRLSRLLADSRLDHYGRRALETFASLVEQSPFSFPQFLIAWDFALGPTREIVIAGSRNDPRTTALLQTVHKHFLPRTVLLLHPDFPEAVAIERLVPFIKNQGLIGGRPAAYVCHQYTCSLPLTAPEALAQSLESQL